MTSTPRTARAVVGVTTLCTLGGAWLLGGAGAAVAVESPARASAGEVSPLPRSFSFDGMSPGQTRSTIVDLASTHATDGSVVEVRVTTSGELAPSISTVVEACHATWVGDDCPTGAVVVVDGWRGGQAGAARQDVVLPAGTTTVLKVSVTLDEGVPAGATGSIRYDLALRGEQEGTPGTGTDPSGPDGSGGADGSGTNGSGAAGDGSGGGPLALTGADVWTLAALSGALLGIGAALVRRRRREERP
ncbi:LPXTG cell wall anchor domain-containing protein [Oerskovia turbata]|uniref:LPXTG cell wall anchor domain-containing protein n=1 Tax=Oerskovia turbata TaxID=1713 RepID=A0A4Q1KSY2_9CELL|nr:LPXTG cell wall anchor domain-containing protein [Oerskovia turbata]RXR25681.1 LPXTG cell wall anchor domain-containing protein [Oerskovia turbata]RXR33231.1 LPXTG cell wall anchor domain-containing protein [Oerskovia turbata]TGJ96300.1 LPXTG cell wall anchor domain-containing protein [Actinotalea fermentans ATCC 43279 = JCM 9966 = DSM 3133]